MARPLRTVLVAAAVAVALYVGWSRVDRAGSPAGAGAADSRPSRGGQLVASLRTEPPTYNRYSPAGAVAATEIVSLLTQAKLVRVNRATDELEPWLASEWTAAADGRAYTLRLREGVVFSDGQPFSSADVLFSLRAAYDPVVNSPLRAALLVRGRPLEVSAPDSHVVVVSFPEPFAPGLRLLDHLPILPRHRLGGALEAGTFNNQWLPSGALSDLAGLGPFVLVEHAAGQRLVFDRNPHYFRRDARGLQLPYLDRLIVALAPDQSTETLRLEAGEVDLLANGEIRPQDYAALKARAAEGSIALLDVGIGLDPDFLSFNLRSARQADPRAAWLLRKEFRQAIACGVDRDAIVNTVYLGAAVPLHGPISPGNRTWFSEAAPKHPYDPGRARQLLTGLGLTDRDGDGMLEDARGIPARFSIVTQAGHIRERVAAVIQEQVRQHGIGVDIAALDPGGIFQRWSAGDYDAIYFGLQASSTDPAMNPELWLSSGAFHFWNPRQSTPATDWEARVDALMAEQATARDLAARQRAFAEVQRILGEELPSIYFVAPRVTIATSRRVANPITAAQVPQLLWSADTLAVRR
ncbi:MAG TPA: ABC transporter substrate-binding protein [Vicinamibacterales bacterium]|nr:ABC transporter substrate-binding protein [Vicinamibacterales bacterium]